jgi:hypothetical protein
VKSVEFLTAYQGSDYSDMLDGFDIDYSKQKEIILNT